MKYPTKHTRTSDAPPRKAALGTGMEKDDLAFCFCDCWYDRYDGSQSCGSADNILLEG